MMLCMALHRPGSPGFLLLKMFSRGSPAPSQQPPHPQAPWPLLQQERPSQPGGHERRDLWFESLSGVEVFHRGCLLTKRGGAWGDLLCSYTRAGGILVC